MKHFKTFLATLAVVGLSITSANAQQKRIAVLFDMDAVASAMPEFEQVKADFEELNEAIADIEKELNDYIPKKIRMFEKQIEETKEEIKQHGNAYECGIKIPRTCYRTDAIEADQCMLSILRGADESSCYHPRKHTFLDLFRRDVVDLQERLSQLKKHRPESATLLWNKIIEFCNKMESKYDIVCFTANDVFYYSPETPDITQWLADRITNKTFSPPAISQTVQKIAKINTEPIQQSINEIRKKEESLFTQYFDTEDENKKAALKKEIEKQEALIAEIQEKFYTAVPVLGKEGNYDFILPAASAEKFSNVVDLTEKVLQKIKTE